MAKPLPDIVLVDDYDLPKILAFSFWACSKCCLNKFASAILGEVYRRI